MRILMAPSEGKTPGTIDQPLDLDNLVFPQLNELRAQLLEELAWVSAQPDALEILGVGARVADAVAANVTLRDGPVGPAYAVYTGVAFEAAKLWELAQQEAGRAALDNLYIMSGLFGVVRATDLIPAYRLTMGTKLPHLGNNATLWKRALKPVLDADMAGELVVDCRSGAYQKPWTSGPDTLVVATKIMRHNGQKLQVISHHAKHWRGLIARACLEQQPQTETELLQVCKTIPQVRDAHLEATRDGLLLTLIAA